MSINAVVLLPPAVRFEDACLVIAVAFGCPIETSGTSLSTDFIHWQKGYSPYYLSCSVYIPVSDDVDDWDCEEIGGYSCREKLFTWHYRGDIAWLGDPQYAGWNMVRFSHEGEDFAVGEYLVGFFGGVLIYHDTDPNVRATVTPGPVEHIAPWTEPAWSMFYRDIRRIRPMDGALIEEIESKLETEDTQEYDLTVSVQREYRATTYFDRNVGVVTNVDDVDTSYPVSDDDDPYGLRSQISLGSATGRARTRSNIRAIKKKKSEPKPRKTHVKKAWSFFRIQIGSRQLTVRAFTLEELTNALKVQGVQFELLKELKAKPTGRVLAAENVKEHVDSLKPKRRLMRLNDEE